jgi:hypothetical protein
VGGGVGWGKSEGKRLEIDEGGKKGRREEGKKGRRWRWRRGGEKAKKKATGADHIPPQLTLATV